MSLNKVHLVGRAGREPEVKYFDSGKMVCNFAIAVNCTKIETDWFDF
jgi:single-strand DNA-binding protein